MKQAVLVLLLALVLAGLTAGVGWLGIKDWDGETGGDLLLMLPGLPLWGCVIALSGIGLHPIAAFTIGGIAQYLCCLVPVAGGWVGVRAVRGRRPRNRSTVVRDEQGRFP